MITPKNRALFFLFIATMCWGSTFSMSKILVSHLSVYTILVIRSLVTSFLLALFFRKSIKKEFFMAMRMPMLWLFCLSNFFGLLFQTMGMKYTTASNSGFITAFSILLVPFIKSWHFKSKISMPFYGAVFLGLIGMYFISFGLALPQGLNRGDLLTLACAICYAYFIVLLEQILKRLSGTTVMIFAFLVSGVLCAPFLLDPVNTSSWSNLTSKLVVTNLALLVFIGGVIPYLLMVYGQKIISAELSAMIYLFEPVFAALVAYFLLGEIMSTGAYLGSGLLLLSLVLALRYNVEEVKV